MAETSIGLEERYLKESHRDYSYPSEKFKLIVVDDSSELGKLTAIRFLQYVVQHPDGVVALPTGRTPELFIKYLQHFKSHWAEVREELKTYGLESENFPDTSRLRFVQLDEFFPLDPKQENSFTSFVRKNYISLLNIAPENALTMEGLIGPTLQKQGISEVFPDGAADLNLLSRKPKTALQKLQKAALEEARQFCNEYEKKVQSWGGIGFFLGGIGRDGHVAFNLPGAHHDSTTRLIPLNYETAAASAAILGGIEQARGKLAATIGLATICSNPHATILIFAAGEGKAPVVAQSIEKSPCIILPATALQKMEGARFYLTKGAARDLKERPFLDYKADPELAVSNAFIDQTFIEISLRKQKELLHLTKRDLQSSLSGQFLIDRFGVKWSELKRQTHKRILEALEKGLQTPKRKTALHTAPQQDDILLSYYPLATASASRNYYACLSSGFPKVTNKFAIHYLEEIKSHLVKEELKKAYAEQLALFRKAIQEASPEQKKVADDLILAKKIEEQFAVPPEKLSDKVGSLIRQVKDLKPGATDPTQIQMLKGLIREAEEDRVWSLVGISPSDVIHLRSKFNDVTSVRGLIEKLQPDLLTVALDPEATAPSSHDQALQLVAAALSKANLESPPTVWGYRNIWDRFRFSEANLLYPISEQEMQNLHKTFLDCYGSQRDASFPAPGYDGTFSGYALEILADQRKQLETILGEAYFADHPDPRVRQAKGLILLKEMTVPELVSHYLKGDFAL